MDHLVCFVPGLLALGAQHIPEHHDEHSNRQQRSHPRRMAPRLGMPPPIRSAAPRGNTDTWNLTKPAPSECEEFGARIRRVRLFPHNAVALAAKLTETCYNMYSRQKTGLAPEFVTFRGGKMNVGARHNLLRPETVESLFLMWRFTKDPKYREWGWRIFVAFEKHCKIATGGYAGLKDVNVDGSHPRNRDDTMQT